MINLKCDDCGQTAFASGPGRKICLPLAQAYAEQAMFVDEDLDNKNGYIIVGVKIKKDSSPEQRAETIIGVFTQEKINYAALTCVHTFKQVGEEIPG